jgi:hypothetical protein
MLNVQRIGVIPFTSWQGCSKKWTPNDMRYDEIELYANNINTFLSLTFTTLERV